VTSELSSLEETLQACSLLPLYNEGDDHWHSNLTFFFFFKDAQELPSHTRGRHRTRRLQRSSRTQTEEEITVESETVNEAGTWEVTQKCSSLQMCARRKKSD
jgi:hypothetical protein